MRATLCLGKTPWRRAPVVAAAAPGAGDAAGDVPLPRLTASLKEFLYRSTPASKYVTLFYAQIDSARRQLRDVRAGHNPSRLFRRP